MLFLLYTKQKKYVQNEKVKFALKQKNYADAILANLSNAGLISKFNGDYYINNTEGDQVVALDRTVAESNRLKLFKAYRLLEHICRIYQFR